MLHSTRGSDATVFIKYYRQVLGGSALAFLAGQPGAAVAIQENVFYELRLNLGLMIRSWDKKAVFCSRRLQPALAWSGNPVLPPG
jgi:hypothetical protein